MTARAIILFGHGSRDPLWRAPMDAVAQRITSAHPDVPVRCAFLELQAPDLAAAAQELAEAGAREITVLPMFLGTGKHAREDLPKRVEAVREAWPALRIDLRTPVGEDERVLALVAAMAME